MNVARAPADGGAHPMAARLVDLACAAGADEADAMVVESEALDVSVRMGEIESSERAEGLSAGLRVLKGKRQATVSTSDPAGGDLAELVERALAMATVTPEDPHAGLPAPQERPGAGGPPPSADGGLPPSAALEEGARAAEDAARAVPGITNSEGGHAASALSRITLAASDGFEGTYLRTAHNLYASVVAGTGTAMERDYEHASRVRAADLDDPADIGRRAGERAVARLNPRKAPSAKVPVVFEPRVAGGFLSLLGQAVSGTAVARGATFLKECLGERVFAPGIRVADDPLRPWGHRSRPFDGEGGRVAERALVEDGILRTWLLDARSARRLGLASTGSAARAPGGVPDPAPSNIYLAPGADSPESIVAGVERGFYVTEMLGMSFSLVTGDYSRGATGFWIENGERTHPVSEVTVAGNLADMFRNLRPADDLAFRTGVDSPTVCIDGMTVAGL